MKTQPISDRIDDLRDWLAMPKLAGVDIGGARVVLDEIAASHAALLAACEAALNWIRPHGGDSAEQADTYKQLLVAIRKARGVE